MVRALLWAIASIAFLFAGPAHADDGSVTGPAAELVREGLAHVEAGEYADAARAFERAYALQPAARLLFNIARAHEKAGEVDRARDDYARYLELPDTEPELKERAEVALARLRPAPPPPSAREAEPPPTPTRASRLEAHAAANGEAPSSVARYRGVGWLAIGVGATAIVTGVVLDTAVLPSMIDDFDAARRAGDGTALGRKNALESMQTAISVTYVVGAVLAAAGTALVLLARSGPSKKAQRGGAGVRASPMPAIGAARF